MFCVQMKPVLGTAKAYFWDKLSGLPRRHKNSACGAGALKIAGDWDLMACRLGWICAGRHCLGTGLNVVLLEKFGDVSRWDDDGQA